MKIYKFEYSTWDEHHSFELYSDEKYSKEELQEMQDNILKQILEEQKANFERIEKFREEISIILSSKTKSDYYISYLEEEIIDEICTFLINQYGFSNVDYENITNINIDNLVENICIGDNKKISKIFQEQYSFIDLLEYLNE